jgi:transposase
MRPQLLVGSLFEEAIAALEARYHQTRDADEHTHCQIVLLSHQSLVAPSIARIVCWRARSVRQVIRRYQVGGLAALHNGRRRNPGRERTIAPEWENKLLETVEQDPYRLRANRATWTAPQTPFIRG